MNNIINKLFLTLTLVLLSIGASAQDKITVTGTVVDGTGETIIGASVMEVGTTNGTVTDFDGNFKLQVKNANAQIRISYIGFTTKTVKVSSKPMQITIEEDDKTLTEVVVVGYGAQKKESVIGAISQVSSKDLLSTPTANVTQAIAGKIPGVVTTQTSGAPGMDDASINIRGRATFAGDGSPLVMVDGVERAFSQVAPDDIESISVLKDASATAVYGVRGANGVILVTTKRGKEMKPEVSFTGNFMWGTATRKPNYLNSYDSVTLLEEALKNDGMASQYSAADLEMYRKACNGELCVIRTMDIGGDKPLPYLNIPHEDNPFLGYRAIRISLNRRDLFMPQLKAILRAGVYGKAAIMAPMVVSVDEILRLRAFVREAMQELEDEGKEYSKSVQLGIMVETPAAAVMTPTFAKYVDFFSIGTNDLVQYTLSVDRVNPNVHYLYNHFHPAVLQLIHRTIKAANDHGIWAGMCGEMASDPYAAVILMAMGINELSMSAPSIPRVKEMIRSVTFEEAKGHLAKVMEMETGEQVLKYLQEAMER